MRKVRWIQGGFVAAALMVAAVASSNPVLGPGYGYESVYGSSSYQIARFLEIYSECFKKELDKDLNRARFGRYPHLPGPYSHPGGVIGGGVPVPRLSDAEIRSKYKDEAKSIRKHAQKVAENLRDRDGIRKPLDRLRDSILDMDRLLYGYETYLVLSYNTGRCYDDLKRLTYRL